MACSRKRIAPMISTKNVSPAPTEQEKHLMCIPLWLQKNPPTERQVISRSTIGIPLKPIITKRDPQYLFNKPGSSRDNSKPESFKQNEIRHMHQRVRIEDFSSENYLPINP